MRSGRARARHRARKAENARLSDPSGSLVVLLDSWQSGSFDFEGPAETRPRYGDDRVRTDSSRTPHDPSRLDRGIPRDACHASGRCCLTVGASSDRDSRTSMPIPMRRPFLTTASWWRKPRRPSYHHKAPGSGQNVARPRWKRAAPCQLRTLGSTWLIAGNASSPGGGEDVRRRR